MKRYIEIASLIVFTLTFSGCSLFKENSDTILRLDIPSNVSFDSNTYTLSWNEVAHADGYKIDINGKVFQSGTNEYNYVPTSKTTTFKVQATDSTNEYIASNWSTDCSYTIPQGQVSLAALNAFVGGMMNGNRQVEKVISIYAEGNYLYTTAKFGNGRVYFLENDYSSDITSLKSIINNGDYGISSYILNSYEAKDYDSISYYLRSDTYKGALEDYRQQGYTFGVVNSQSYRMSSGTMGIGTLFKLTNGLDVKYVASGLEFYISDTATESIKYTTGIVNIGNDMIETNYCTELTGDFVDYAKVIEKEYAHQ
ncbi:MAG: hypothetical protein IJQ92_01545 [Bacilli bacterium]|nr:hypothetical protein [Bacilli bacterium]